MLAEKATQAVLLTLEGAVMLRRAKAAISQVVGAINALDRQAKDTDCGITQPKVGT